MLDQTGADTGFFSGEGNPGAERPKKIPPPEFLRAGQGGGQILGRPRFFFKYQA